MKRHIIPIACAAALIVAGCSSDNETPTDPTTPAEVTTSAEVIEEESEEATTDPATEPSEDESDDPGATAEGTVYQHEDIPDDSGPGGSSPQAVTKKMMTAMVTKNPSLLCTTVEDQTMKTAQGEIPCMDAAPNVVAGIPDSATTDGLTYEVFERDGRTVVKVMQPSASEPLEMFVVESGGTWFIASDQDS